VHGVADGANGPQLGVAVVWQAAVHRGAALSAMANGAVKHHGEDEWVEGQVIGERESNHFAQKKRLQK
jgi:hypothetical protein